MDRFWTEAADFLVANGFRDGVAAPVELGEALPVGIAYAQARARDGGQTRALVLHKGRYRELDRAFLRATLARLHPVFANEVFIILADEGEALPEEHPHIGALPEIRVWADAASGNGPPARTGRMSSTYVGNGKVLTETVHGHLMVLIAEDRSITPHILRDGFIEWGITRFIEGFLRPGMTFVDVGANVGLYTVLGAAGVGPGGRVVAIEAIPRFCEMIVDNLMMNGLFPRVSVLPLAATETEGEFTIHEIPRYAGGSSMVERVVREVEERYFLTAIPHRIRGKPLSAILDGVEVARADLIKIDVEGSERGVLLGARDFLRRQPAVNLLLEWHPDFLSPAAMAELYGILTQELGCTVEIVAPDGGTGAVTFEVLCTMHHADLFAHRG